MFVEVRGGTSRLLLASSPPISASIQIARPIMNGIEELLLGVSSGSPYLGLHQAFTHANGSGANCLKPGYLAVILAEEGEIVSGDLWVANDRLRVGKTAESSTPLKDFAYMLLRIESGQNRDDIGWPDRHKQALWRLQDGPLISGEEDRAGNAS